MAERTRPLASSRPLGDGDIGLWVRYEDRAQAKALPGARWDPKLKCWRVDAMFRADAEALVNHLNGGIDGTFVNLLVTVLRNVPPELRVKTFRALMRCWHPDVAGVAATRLTQALTEAWRQV